MVHHQRRLINSVSVIIFIIVVIHKWTVVTAILKTVVCLSFLKDGPLLTHWQIFLNAIVVIASTVLMDRHDFILMNRTSLLLEICILRLRYIVEEVSAGLNNSSVIDHQVLVICNVFLIVAIINSRLHYLVWLHLCLSTGEFGLQNISALRIVRLFDDWSACRINEMLAWCGCGNICYSCSLSSHELILNRANNMRIRCLEGKVIHWSFEHVCLSKYIFFVIMHIYELN